MPTLLLNHAAIACSIRLTDCIDAVEQAFRRLAESRMTLPAVVHIPAPEGAFHVKSAAFVGAPGHVAVKINANFPDNPLCNGLPTIQGVIVLCDGRNGAVLAVMDSAEVTALRTGAATAVAAKYLANPGIDTAAVIGCGVQGRIQLRALLEVLPLAGVFACDLDRERRETFAAEMSRETGVEVFATESLAEATLQSRAIATCTTSRAAFLRPEHVAPGTFIAAVGADNHNKQELDPALLRGARVVADVLEQCAEIGDLHHALAAGVMTRADICAELAEVVSGAVTVPAREEDVTVFDSTGSAIQDVAAASLIYERARAAGLGFAIDFS